MQSLATVLGFACVGYYTLSHVVLGRGAIFVPHSQYDENVVVPETDEVPFEGWRYSTSIDPVLGDRTTHAKVLGTGPGGATNPASLELTASHRYGRHITVTFGHVAKACGANACQVSVAWDHAPPTAYPFDDMSAADKSKTILQLGEYDRFMGGLAKAHAVKVVASLGMPDDYVATFPVTGFKPPALP
jgi:hypothetical protein